MSHKLGTSISVKVCDLSLAYQRLQLYQEVSPLALAFENYRQIKKTTQIQFNSFITSDENSHPLLALIRWKWQEYTSSSTFQTTHYPAIWSILVNKAHIPSATGYSPNGIGIISIITNTHQNPKFFISSSSTADSMDSLAKMALTKHRWHTCMICWWTVVLKCLNRDEKAMQNWASDIKDSDSSRMVVYDVGPEFSRCYRLSGQPSQHNFSGSLVEIQRLRM